MDLIQSLIGLMHMAVLDKAGQAFNEYHILPNWDMIRGIDINVILSRHRTVIYDKTLDIV